MQGPSYEIANWSVFQHYKERNPPWIKLHFSLLCGETWVRLDDASRVLAVACMLIASRNDGHVPANPEYIRRVAYLNQRPNFKPLIDTGFLIDASTMQADASTTQADASTTQADARPETEKRQRREEKRQTRASKPALDGFEEFWRAYPRKAGKGKAEQEWAKVPKDAHADIQAAIAKQLMSEDWTKDGGRFIPHPSTWLHQRRWEDVVMDYQELDIERRAARLRALG